MPLLALAPEQPAACSEPSLKGVGPTVGTAFDEKNGLSNQKLIFYIKDKINHKIYVTLRSVHCIKGPETYLFAQWLSQTKITNLCVFFIKKSKKWERMTESNKK